MSYKVRISSFEGPFDLLVYLIENMQMSIYDIQISEITGQYMEYMKDLNTIDVERATEFMVLAASLIEIKSKMLLPTEDEDVEGIVEEDPRSQLVEKLIEYKAFKKKAGMLAKRFDENQDVMEKPQEDIQEYTNNPDEYLSLEIDEFVKAFNAFIERKQRIDQVRERYTRLERDRISMESRMEYIMERFKKENKASGRSAKINLRDLVPGKHDNYNLVVTFAATLQMINQKSIIAEQKSIYGDILLKLSENTKKIESKEIS